MPRSKAYTELLPLAREVMDRLEHESIELTDLPMYIEKKTMINQRVDMPVEYDGKKYWLTLRRRNG